MKRFSLALFAFGLLSLFPNIAGAISLADIFGNDKKALEEEAARQKIITEQEEVDTRTEALSLTKDFCASLTTDEARTYCEDSLSQKDVKQLILEKKEKSRLSSAYCSTIETRELYLFCKKQLVEQKKKVRSRNDILEKRRAFELTEDYCNSQKEYDYYTLCKDLLIEQDSECSDDMKTFGKKLYIDLGEQMIYGVKNCKLIVYSRILSGKNSTPSPTGKYKIYSRRGPHYMQGEWYVTQAFYFRGGFAVHNAGWRKTPKMWAKWYRSYGGSHGCINTPFDAMDIIWNEFEVGDPVELYYTIPDDIKSELTSKIGDRQPIDPSEGL